MGCVTTVWRQWTMNWKQCGRKRLWPNLRYRPGSSWTDSGRPHKLCQDNLCSGRDAKQELWNTSKKGWPLAQGFKGFCNSVKKRHNFRHSERGAKNLALRWVSPSVSLDWQIDILCVWEQEVGCDREAVYHGRAVLRLITQRFAVWTSVTQLLSTDNSYSAVNTLRLSCISRPVNAVSDGRKHHYWMLNLAVSGTQVCGFKPGRSRWIFTVVKIFSMPSSGAEVKESVPCPSFAACKRT